jgi:hypothetical protein
VSRERAPGSSTAFLAHEARAPGHAVLFGDRSLERRRGRIPGGTAKAFRIKNGVTGTVQSISVFLAAGTRARALVAGLYSDRGTRPGRLLTSGSLSRPGVRAWDSVTVRRPFRVTAGTAYWIVVLGKGGALRVRYRRHAACRAERSRGRRMTALPSTWRGVRSRGCPVSAYVSGTPATRGGSPLPGVPQIRTSPTISGTAVVGRALTTSNGSWSNSPKSYAYAWEDCNRSGSDCSRIGGASSASYVLRAKDVGHTIRSVVTATNDGGSKSATSASVGPVTASSSPPPPSGLQSFAYWLGWQPNSFAESALPWSDLTRVTMFSAEVNADATLSLTQNSLQLYDMPAWTAMLHQHGVQAFITLGDNNTDGGAWNSACSASEDQTLATNLVSYATANGFDGVDLDIEDAVTPLSQLEACVQQISSQAHAAGLLVSAEQNQSIPTTNPYSEVAPDISYLDSAVDEYYGYNPANNWNCGTGTPYGTCAYVAQLDGSTIRAGQLASKTLLGMATCCGAAQAAYSNLSTTSGAVDTSGSVASLALASGLSAALPAGNVVVSDGGESHYEVFSTSGAAAGATSIPITGSVRGNGSFQFPAGSEVQSDYAGPWDCYNMAAYAHANGYQGSMDFALQSEYGAYNKSFPCLDQIALGLGLN